MRKLTVVLLLTVLLVSCSRIKIAYRQLDWLLPFYIETYMDFSAQQSHYLKQQVESLLIWHCQQQLSAYAILLRQINADVQNGDITQAKLRLYNDQFKFFWVNIMGKSYPVIVQLLKTSEESQLQALFTLLSEKNRAWFEEFQQQTAAELRQQYSENSIEILQDWLGDVHEKQHQAVQQWSVDFQALGKVGFDMRNIWQSKLRELSQQRENDAVFNAGIKTLFVHPEKIRTVLYQQRLEHNQQLTIALLYTISRQLSSAQRKHLRDKMLSMAQDFDDLACDKQS